MRSEVDMQRRRPRPCSCLPRSSDRLFSYTSKVACEHFLSLLFLLPSLTRGRFDSSLCLCLCVCLCVCVRVSVCLGMGKGMCMCTCMCMCLCMCICTYMCVECVWKDGERTVSREKSGETPVEASRETNTQIVRYIFSWERKTNRTISRLVPSNISPG